MRDGPPLIIKVFAILVVVLGSLFILITLYADWVKALHATP